LQSGYGPQAHQPEATSSTRILIVVLVAVTGVIALGAIGIGVLVWYHGEQQRAARSSERPAADTPPASPPARRRPDLPTTGEPTYAAVYVYPACKLRNCHGGEHDVPDESPGCKSCDYGRLRASPSLSGRPLIDIPVNTRVEVLGRAGDQWCKVRYADYEGFVYRDVLQPTCVPAPPVAARKIGCTPVAEPPGGCSRGNSVYDAWGTLWGCADGSSSCVYDQ
jgi:hypothetical protein